MNTRPEERKYLARQLVALARYCFQNPRQALTTCGVFFFLSVVTAWIGLELQMDWTYLFEDDDPVVVRINEARDLFPYPGDIAVLVDRGTPEQRIDFLEELADRLAEEPDLFYHVFYKFDLEPLSSKALYYLGEPELKKLASGLRAYHRGSTGGPMNPTGRKILLKLLDDLDHSLKERGRFEYTPIWEVLAEDHSAARSYLSKLMTGERYVYSTLGAGRIHALILKSGTDGPQVHKKSSTVKRLRTILGELSPTVRGIRIRLTGLPVLLHDERETCTSDSIRSAAISIVLILLIFMIGFGEVSRPAMAVTALTCGLGWTMGYTTLVVGHLNFITVGMITMLMGLGIDFGIHLIFRYNEELRQGRSPLEAIEFTMAGTGLDTLVGALATAVAFLALTFAGFRGIADLGVIASGGVLLCFLSTATVLPALLALVPQRGRNSRPERLQPLENWLLSRAKKVAALGLILAGLAASWGAKVDFNYNLLSVQAPQLESVRTEIEMIQELKNTVLSGAVVAKDMKEARELSKRLEALPSVARVSSVATFLPEVTPTKQKLVEEITHLVGGVEVPVRVPLESAQDLLAVEQKVRDFEKGLPGGSKDPEVEKVVAQLKAEVRTMDPGPVQDGLKSFQAVLREDLNSTLELLQKQQAVAPGLDDIPEDLLIRYVAPTGEINVKIQPMRNIWEKEHLDEFLSDLHTVHSELLGHPVVQNHILEAFARAYKRTPWFTLVGVLLVMLAYLRSPQAVMLSLLPTAMGVVGIFGAMGYWNIDFNVVNFVALPMSVGIGAVYGVHALHRMRELNDETLLSSSTGPALLLSGITTVVGFASLMTAHHRGLASLGFIISVGVAVNFIVSLVFLPAVRRVLRLR